MNGLNDPVRSSLSNHAMATYAVPADSRAPTAMAPNSGSVDHWDDLNATSNPAPVIAGAASNIEKRAAASRVMPKASPAAIVTPEREIPGKNAVT